MASTSGMRGRLSASAVAKLEAAAVAAAAEADDARAALAAKWQEMAAIVSKAGEWVSGEGHGTSIDRTPSDTNAGSGVMHASRSANFAHFARTHPSAPLDRSKDKHVTRRHCSCESC